MGTKVNRLNQLQSFMLMNLIKEEYAASKMDDPQFAEYAKTKLGFEVGESAMTYRRKELGIESNRAYPTDTLGTGVVGKENRIKLELLWEFVSGMSPELVKQLKERLEA